MNIYEKIINITNELQSMDIKKTGINQYTKFKYFELTDLTPPINQLCAKYKVMINIKYDKELAKMTLINAEKPEEQLEYTSPIGKVEIKGAYEMQNLGAAQTYLRRYFFLTAFNISENDTIDKIKEDPILESKNTIDEIVELYKETINSDEGKIEKLKERLKNKSLSYLKEKKKELINMSICQALK